MNKYEYLSALDKELKKLPEEERRNAILYYTEYFDDAGVENEGRVIMELGHPKDVANTLLSEYAIKTMNAPASTFTKKGLGKIKWLIIALVASPIALPVVGMLIMFLLSVIGITAFFVASVAALSIVGIAGGIVAVAMGVFFMFTDIGTALVGIGIGLAAISLGLLMGLMGIHLGRLICKGIRALVTKIVERRKHNEKAKEID